MVSVRLRIYFALLKYPTLLIYLAGPIVEDAINRKGPIADSNGVRSSVADKPRSLPSTGRLTVGHTLTTTCVHKSLHITNKACNPPDIPNYPRWKWNQVKQAWYGTLTEGSSSMVAAGGGAAAATAGCFGLLWSSSRSH